MKLGTDANEVNEQLECKCSLSTIDIRLKEMRHLLFGIPLLDSDKVVFLSSNYADVG